MKFRWLIHKVHGLYWVAKYSLSFLSNYRKLELYRGLISQQASWKGEKKSPLHSVFNYETIIKLISKALSDQICQHQLSFQATEWKRFQLELRSLFFLFLFFVCCWNQTPSVSKIANIIRNKYVPVIIKYIICHTRTAGLSVIATKTIWGRGLKWSFISLIENAFVAVKLQTHLNTKSLFCFFKRQSQLQRCNSC